MGVSLPRKDLFEIPDGIIYLDGNSLGVLPKGAAIRATRVIEEEWGGQLIRAWNSAGWMDLPRVVGNRIADLIGAPEGSVATGDTLSIKVYQALDAALKMRPGRRVILSDDGNFPSDLYMAQGLIGTIDKGYELRTPAPEAVVDAISEDVAVVMLTHVDYRSGRMHDMKAVTKAAHAAGAVMIWDLAHSAGALELDIAGSDAEFAVGCSYKYLNGGPGAPAFIYARPDIVEGIALLVPVVVMTAFVGLFFLPFLFFVTGFIYRVATITGRSATWGMRLMSIEFRDSRGEHFDFSQAFMHTLGYTVSMAIFPLQLISIAMMFLTERGQGLTDMLLGTVAINRRL